MLQSLPAVIQFDLAILATALAWAIGFYIADRRWHVFASLAIGCFVCLIGWSVGSLNAPAWLVVAAPIPFDFLLQWYVLRSWRKIAIAYPCTWAAYTLLHMALSAGLRYDYLIPPWKLHG